MRIDKGHRVQDYTVTVKCKVCMGSHNTCLWDAKSQQSSGAVDGQPTESSPTSMLVGTESRVAL